MVFIKDEPEEDIMNFLVNKFIKTILLLVLAILFVSLEIGQYITGSLVNAVLFISAYSLGWPVGVLIGAAIPWVSSNIRILNPVFTDIVPFLMMSNGLLVLVFSLVRTFNAYIGIIAASLVKFGMMFAITRFVLDLNAGMNPYLQLYEFISILIGGVVALFVISAINSVEIVPRMGSAKSRITRI